MINFNPSITVTRLEWSDHLLSEVARKALQKSNNAADLSKLCIILSEGRAIPQCRMHLAQEALKNNIRALIGPDITSFDHLAAQTPLVDRRVVNNSALQLILMDALKEHNYLYGKASPLALANDLLQLFEQITRYDLQLPEPASELIRRFQQAYANQDNATAIDSRFADRESRLIQQIWQGLKNQLGQDGQVDSASAYAIQLELAAKKRQGWTVIYAGLEPMTNLEKHCLNLLAQNNSVEIISYCANEDDFYAEFDPTANNIANYPNFYDYLLRAEPQEFGLRKHACLTRFPNSPIQNKLFIYACLNLEQEAQAIELQIRDWLSLNKRNVAFICNDRKLARRVRARLERYHIHFNDKSGWSLSTSRSASIVERWLQCLESDFNYQPFLDLLKSPLIIDHDMEKAWLTAIYTFEKNIVYFEQINSGLTRFHHACENALRKLPDSLHAPYQFMLALLQKFQRAADLLHPFLSDEHSPNHILDALIKSLSQLGCAQPLTRDHVGNLLMNTLAQLKQSAEIANINAGWTEFRAWLGYNLEFARFNPPTQASPVQLLTLEQSDIQEFDAIVIGGAQIDFLPGHVRSSTFFNDSACKNLGLPDIKTLFTRSFHYFRRLIAQTGRDASDVPLLICHRLFNNQEPVSLCPWVEAIQTNHRLIYQNTLHAFQVEHWMSQLSEQQREIDTDTETIQVSRASIPPTLIPKTFSASHYQQLVNCPYQFYAARALHLHAPDSIRNYMEKSDYGDLVHTCLRVFHFGSDAFGAAFNQSINDSNKFLAKSYLRQLSDKIFAQAIGENFIHRAWRKKWERCIDPYIEWYQSQQGVWRPLMGEVTLKMDTPQGVVLNSKIDRIDHAEKQLRIIDYKTGIPPKNADVENGEAVQLPFYALLLKKHQGVDDSKITQLAYLKLDDADLRLISTLDTEQIDDICDKHQRRLNQLFSEIARGQSMSAWGDESVCVHCDFQGLCRREFTQLKLEWS